MRRTVCFHEKRGNIDHVSVDRQQLPINVHDVAHSDILGGANPADLPFSDVIRVLRIENPDIPISADESVFQAAGSVAAKIDERPVITGLNATLFPYQAQGVEWMLRTIRHTGGVILADEMGLGKTIQIIALLLADRPAVDDGTRNEYRVTHMTGYFRAQGAAPGDILTLSGSPGSRRFRISVRKAQAPDAPTRIRLKGWQRVY